jgi:serine protease Do
MSEATLKAIKVAQFGNSDDIQVGEQAVAIGNPLGAEFENSVTQGIISALNRQIQVDDRNLTVIQTDVAINPGNSGGALVNSKGQVIGINSVKINLTEVEGMGFAIPTKVAIPIFEDLIANGAIQRPQLGIKGTNVTQDIGQIYALPTGVYVAEVLKGSSAEAAGIMAKDIITDFNGEKILSMEQLSSLIKACKVGDTVEIRIVRNGKTAKTLNITLQAGK